MCAGVGDGERNIEVVRFVNDGGGAYIAAVGEHCICKCVALSVLIVVGGSCASEQSGFNVTVLYRPAVFAVVENGEAEAVVGEIRPLVSADLKLRIIPCGVLVRRTFQVAELDIEGRFDRVDIDGVVGFERDSLFMPVDIVENIYSCGVRIEYEVLSYR